ncbi:Glycosyl transferase, group 2 family [Thiocapsa sp. KS1]|nr:Glycosyl transferase, group 2 family [Thiocapsa sp. KS1]
MEPERIPAISIITPVWNGLPYLRECIESVERQHFTNWELLISDDGSTDGSAEFLETLNNPRIRVFRQQNNLGIFGNLNFLFGKARAPISQILCQDDYLTGQSSLDKIHHYWTQARPDVGFACFNRLSFPERWFMGFIKYQQPLDVIPEVSDLCFFLFGCMPGNLSNVTLRTSVVSASGWFREDLPYLGDFEFWSRAARSYSSVYEWDVVTHIRSHSEQASKRYYRRGEYMVQEARVLNELYDRLTSIAPVSRPLLRVHATIRYICPQMNNAIRGLLRGSALHWKELRLMRSITKYHLGLGVTWFLFVVSLGGRIGAQVTARSLLAREKAVSCRVS